MVTKLLGCSLHRSIRLSMGVLHRTVRAGPVRAAEITPMPRAVTRTMVTQSAAPAPETAGHAAVPHKPHHTRASRTQRGTTYCAAVPYPSSFDRSYSTHNTSPSRADLDAMPTPPFPHHDFVYIENAVTQDEAELLLAEFLPKLKRRR